MPSQHSTDLRSGLTRPSILKNRHDDTSPASSFDKSRKSSGKTVVIRVPLLRYEIEDQKGLGPCSLLDSLTIREADEHPSKGDSSPVSGVTYYDAPHTHTVYTANLSDPYDSDPEREAIAGEDDDAEVNCSSNPNDMGPELEFPLDGFSAVEQSFKAKARKQAEALGKPFEWPERPVHGDGTPTYLPHEEWLAATRNQRLSQGTEVAKWYKAERGPSFWRKARSHAANEEVRRSRTKLDLLDGGSIGESASSATLKTVPGLGGFIDNDHSDADDENGEYEPESEDECLTMPTVTRNQSKGTLLYELATSGRPGTPALSAGSSSHPSSPFSPKMFEQRGRIDTTGSASGTDKEYPLKTSRAPAASKRGFFLGTSSDEDDYDSD